MDDLGSMTESLFSSQLAAWETARENYAALGGVRSKVLSEGGFEVAVQFNPGRRRSSLAGADGACREQRCLLCGENRPEAQKGIGFGDYEILVNPWPIFQRHLTIPLKEHTPQTIGGRMADMLSLAENLQEYTITYNGPRSGASIPGHHHFQAVPKEALPAAFCGGHGTLFQEDTFLRKTILISGSDRAEIIARAEKMIGELAHLSGEEGEPGLNILAGYGGGTYGIAIFPRRAHRPRQFFAEGDEKLLVSPGAVDFGGVVITVREEDFDRIDAATLKDIFSQLTLEDDKWIELKRIFKDYEAACH